MTRHRPDDDVDREVELVPTGLVATVIIASWMLSGLLGLGLAVHGGLGNEPDDLVANASVVSIVLAALSYLTWCWWCTTAAVNAHRITPLATSPMLPPVVYLGGPAILLVAMNGTGDLRRYGPGVGIAVTALGHLAVVFSLRSTARRLRGNDGSMTRLIWVPVFVSAAGRALLMWLSSALSDDELEGSAVGLASIVALVHAGLIWAATSSFDRLCESRIAERHATGVPPSADVVLASMFRGTR
jgi:hypothetical protein